MTDARRIEIAEEFLASFSSMIRGMDAVFRKELESFGVTWPQLHMLKVLERAGRMTVTELSNCMLVAAPTASRMIDFLCAKRLLEKERNVADHRVTYVKPTPESETLLKRLRGLQEQVMMGVFEGESTEDLERNVTILGRMADRLSAGAEIKTRRGATDE